VGRLVRGAPFLGDAERAQLLGGNAARFLGQRVTVG
jgi:hypothetical protein